MKAKYKAMLISKGGRKMAPQTFWMVWVHDTPTTEKRHPSYLEAQQEADRVARQPKNSGKKVYILQALDYRVVEHPLTVVIL